MASLPRGRFVSRPTPPTAPLLLAHPEPLHTPLPCESRPPMKAPTDPAAPPEDPASPPLTPLPAETALPAAELSGPEVGEETALGEAGPDEVAVAEVEEGPGVLLQGESPVWRPKPVESRLHVHLSGTRCMHPNL